jgi:two-component system chemotaxis response regulator CheB
MTDTRKIRVLIVDDSALVRNVLTEILAADPGIEVVGTAPDPYVAREKIKALNPDVLTLDVEMPRMDGITFLGNLMRLRPMPVVMVSTLTEKGAETTLEALALGAVDFVAKPREDVSGRLGDYAEEIIGKVKAAARASVRALARDASPAAATGKPAKAAAGAGRAAERLIAIGSSTGGTEAVKDILVHLPPDAPGIVIAQHIPPGFSAAFARRLDDLTALTVCEAVDRQPILTGHAYVAPGGRHLHVERESSRYLCRVTDDAPVNLHKPSVDVLFHSVAKCAGDRAVGAILTGMGNDGAKGLKAMREAGATTIAQDQATSVVWGMPGEAVKLGAVAAVLPLWKIADALMGNMEAVKRAAG